MAAYLLDTHVALWWWAGSPRLSARAREVIADSGDRMLVSAASVWEIATKWRLGKLDDIGDVEENYARLMERDRFESLAVTEKHAMCAGLFAESHSDPFDRMIAAQSLIEGVAVITRDPALATFGCEVIW